jgi:hypothetical protein
MERSARTAWPVRSAQTSYQGRVAACDLVLESIDIPDAASPSGDAKDKSPKLRLTALGDRILEGNEDHVGLNGIDRWIGGVHLIGKTVRWRWDEKQGRIIQTKKKQAVSAN